MHEINFIDRSFDKDSEGIYSLSIQANQHGLTFCIADDKNNRYVLFRKHLFEHVYLIGDLIEKIAQVFKTDEEINFQFHAVRFMGFTQQSTLVPDAYFDSTRMHDYLAFNHADDVDHELFNNHILPPNIHNVFALPRELVSLITLQFKKVEFLTQTTPFIRHITYQKKVFEKTAVYVGINPGFFDIACTGDGLLKLYNTFQYASETDLLYYVIFVYKQMGFDTQKVPLYLSGEMISKSTFYVLLKQYIPVISYDQVVNVPTLPERLKQLDATRFLNLLNLKMCASLVEPTGAEK